MPARWKKQSKPRLQRPATYNSSAQRWRLHGAHHAGFKRQVFDVPYTIRGVHAMSIAHYAVRPHVAS
jgi:hypothetical protein